MSTWHTCKDGKLREGKQKDCFFCKTYKPKTPAGECGRKGGLKAAKGRKKRKPAFCKRCGKPRTPTAASGLCRDCFHLEAKERREAKVRNCSRCDKPISASSKSGLCATCFQKSPTMELAREEYQAYLSAAVFNRNANPSEKVLRASKDDEE